MGAQFGRKFDSSVRFFWAETCRLVKKDYPKVWFTSQNGEQKKVKGNP